jgi:hypothetical protein
MADVFPAEDGNICSAPTNVSVVFVVKEDELP